MIPEININTENIKFIIPMLLIVIISIFFIKNVIFLITNKNLMSESNRKRQLDYAGKTNRITREEKNLLSTISDKFDDAILHKMVSEKTNNKYENKLLLAGWKISVMDYFTLSILLVFGGIFAGLLVYAAIGMTAAAVIIGAVIALIIHFLLHNSISTRRFNLLSNFPDLIQMIEGNLISGIPLVQAIEKTLPYLTDEWEKVINDFVLNSETMSQIECLSYIKEMLPIFEIQEFWSLVQLSIEQGIDVRDCFQGQKEKIKQLRRESIISKIGARKTMAIFVQAPLLLCMIIGFALPTFAQMMNM